MTNPHATSTPSPIGKEGEPEPVALGKTGAASAWLHDIATDDSTNADLSEHILTVLEALHAYDQWTDRLNERAEEASKRIEELERKLASAEAQAFALRDEARKLAVDRGVFQGRAEAAEAAEARADSLAADNARLREALVACADALEAHIPDYRRPGHKLSEVYERRYEDDMRPVKAARAALASSTEPKESK